MAEEPELALLIEAPVLGELGPGTERHFDVSCDVCERRVPRYERTELVLDRWKGQHLFHIYGEPYVSDDLRRALDEGGITGAAFEPVAAASVKRAADLPAFHRLVVTGRAEGPDDWWNLTKTCEACGDEKWWPTPDSIRSGGGPSTTETNEDVVDPLPLRVYRDGWNGDGIFEMQSPSPVVVTSDFIAVAQAVGVPGVHFRPTAFVDRAD